MTIHGVALQSLERAQMEELVGGMEAIAPSTDSNAAYDFGWLLGKVCAGFVYLITTPPPASNYYYAKTGYPS